MQQNIIFNINYFQMEMNKIVNTKSQIQVEN